MIGFFLQKVSFRPFDSRSPTSGPSHRVDRSLQINPGRSWPAIMQQHQQASRGFDKTSSLAMLGQQEQELDDDFTGLAAGGLMSIAGFGSLLSIRSALSTFPNLTNFRTGKLKGYRRIFAHTCAIFFQRGIAKPETGEISSLSVEQSPEDDIVVSVFEVPASKASIQAFIEREHEFRFVAAMPVALDDSPLGTTAVICGRWNDEDYRLRRCPPEEFHRRYGQFGIDIVWREDVLPCRVYLRHCVLAAQRLGPQAHASFLDHTFLADRRTTIRAWLHLHPEILEELPPPELAERYGG